MDGSQYPTNGLNGSSQPQTYPSPTAISPNQLQTGSPLPQTLPPLQPPTAAMQPMYGSHPHTPRTPGTPNTPNSASNLPNYQNTSQPAPRPGVYSMAQNPYPPNQGYGTSAPMMPQATTAASHPQPIAPAPVGGRGPPVLRPMPPGGLMGQPGVSSPYGPGSMMQPNVLQEGDQPTHVVGSQGRRGILPSAPGRPAAPTAGTGAKSNIIPVKDADGKFPCPHCTKTYLHAKHLKRHLLRHTGDRPYMCVLCRDTFSRSDILKRHFQKCSIRRGNPTGASHLSHPQAHVKKNAQAQKAAGLGNEGDMQHLNGLNNMPGDGMVPHPFTMVPVNDGMNNMGGDQNHLSRSSSHGGPQDRNNMAPSMGAPQPYGANVSNSMNNPQMPSYSMPPGQNGMPIYGGSNGNQQSGLDWSQMFQAGAQSLNSNLFHPPNRGQTQIATRTDPKQHDSEAANGSPSDSARYSMWGMSMNYETSFSQLSNQILNFLYPPNEAIDPSLMGMNLYFSPDNTKEFIDQYSHFHEHVPLVHPSSLRLSEAFPGLVACMCCIGACYSNRVSLADVREMMDALWVAMERRCWLMSDASQTAQTSQIIETSHGEEQAVLLLGILHLVNGTAHQRRRALSIPPVMAAQVHRLGLLGLSCDPLMYSVVHHSNADDVEFKPEDFVWELWIGQELRLRLMHAVLAFDTLVELLFGIPAHFDPADIHLPLPCSAEAWNAANCYDCASALGILSDDSIGADLNRQVRHASQPDVHLARQVMLERDLQFQTGALNILGQVLLGVVLIATIQITKRLGSVNVLDVRDRLVSLSWVSSTASETTSTGSAAMDISPSLTPESLLMLRSAVDKLSKCWAQQTSQRNSRRTTTMSVLRNGIALTLIARHLLMREKAPAGVGSDDVFRTTCQALRSACKQWSISGSDKRDDPMISEETRLQHGREEEDLDLVQLFRPASQE